MDPPDLGPDTATWLGGTGTVLLGVFLWLRKFLSKDAADRAMDSADTRQQCEAYDPTKYVGRNIHLKWRTLFEDTQALFREHTDEIPIANRAYRLRAIGRMAEKADNMKNMALTAQLLEQAAKEVGDVYVNRRVEPEKPLGSHADQQHAVAEYTLEPDENVPATQR